MALLADAEAGEDYAQKIIGRHLARDLPQGLMGESKFFGQKVQRGRGRRQLKPSLLQVQGAALQSQQVPCARQRQPLGYGLPPRAAQQFLAQGLQAGALAGRDPKPWP